LVSYILGNPGFLQAALISPWRKKDPVHIAVVPDRAL